MLRLFSRAPIGVLRRFRREFAEELGGKSVISYANIRKRSTASTTSSDKDGFFDDDYRGLIKIADEKLCKILDSPSRFQSIDEREDRSAIPKSSILYESTGKYITKYRGAFMLKNCIDLAVCNQLLCHVQPRTVLEIGTFNTGALALWYDDTAKLQDYDCTIYSIDHEPALLNEEIKHSKPDTVKFIVGDSSKIDEIFPSPMLASLPHPWVVIEGSHDNAANILTYLGKSMNIGDYLIVENTSPNVPSTYNIKIVTEEKPNTDAVCGREKLDTLRNFLRGPVGKNFKVDSFFTDLYGYNCTYHWHGFIRKCTE